MESVPIQRPFGFTLRRHRLVFLAVACLLSSAVFMVAPMMRRTYELSGTMAVKPVGFEGIPELGRLVGAAVNAEGKGKTQIKVMGDAGSGQTIQIAAAAGTRDAAVVQVQGAADRIAAKVRQTSEELKQAYQGVLLKQRERLGAREESLVKGIETFRQSHRGVLPDDPASVLAQFEKLSGRLDEKQQRVRVVTEQITRLEDYKRRLAAGNVAAPPPPPPVLMPAGDAGGKPAVKAADDPEVMSLTAQIQLINEQIDEQLTTRTEQHPYVVDLRSKLVALQKKMEAAKQRAAAGQPAPPEARAVLSNAGRGADPTLAAAQQVELQMQSLQAEQSALEAEVLTLTSQRTVMQKDVDAVLPLRREYEQLGEQLAGVRKEKQMVQGKVEEFEKRFGVVGSTEGGVGGMEQAAAVEVGPLVMAGGSMLPTFPRLSLVYPAGLMVGLMAAVGLAGMLHRRDHYLHDHREVGAVADVPVLGVISEIRTGGRREMLGLWQSAGRPLVAVGLVLMLVGSAMVCFRSLAECG